MVIIIEDNQLAALVILLVSSLGTIANWFIAIYIRQMKTLQNPFGWLTGSQAIGEAVICTMFCFYFVPMVFFDIAWMKYYSYHFGHLSVVMYEICIYSHLCISLNRMCAIFMPLRYNNIFSYRNTQILIFISWALAIVPSIFLYVIGDCKFTYSDDYFNFVFSVNDFCNFVAWYTDVLKYISVVLIIVIIDIITVTKVHFTHTAISKSISSRNVQSRRGDEINFLKQACLQAGVFVFELILYFILESKFDGKWVKFFMSTFAWNCVHTSDGFITIIFNKEFRTVIPCLSQRHAVAPRGVSKIATISTKTAEGSSQPKSTSENMEA